MPVAARQANRRYADVARLFGRLGMLDDTAKAMAACAIVWLVFARGCLRHPSTTLTSVK